MPQLDKNAPAALVHRLGDEAPARDLFGIVNTRGGGIADTLGGDLRGLGDDQPGRRPLRVILGVDGLGHVAGARAVARHRGHDDAVGQGVGAELEG